MIGFALDCERYIKQRRELHRERERRNKSTKRAICHSVEVKSDNRDRRHTSKSENTCFSCGRRGHISRECRNKEKIVHTKLVFFSIIVKYPVIPRKFVIKDVKMEVNKNFSSHLNSNRVHHTDAVTNPQPLAATSKTV